MGKNPRCLVVSFWLENAARRLGQHSEGKGERQVIFVQDTGGSQEGEGF